MQCKIEGCEKDAQPGRKGMCVTHYGRWHRHGNPLKGTDYIQRQCSIEGCTNLTKWLNGLCLQHYKQQWYLNSVGKDEVEVRVRSEKYINPATGYVMVFQGDKLEYEHRVLAEKALGKPLPPKAIIHHTGARDDNYGFCKLVICPNQEYHLLLHKRMEEGYGKDN